MKYIRAALVMARTVSYSDYAEELWNNGFFDDIIDDSYWSGGYDGERLLTAMEHEAKRHSITLTDEGDFDYDDVFYDMYQTMEKGLS